jgi:hypothetical protein
MNTTKRGLIASVGICGFLFGALAMDLYLDGLVGAEAVEANDQKQDALEQGTASYYASQVEEELGPIPTFNCQDGVLIPITVNGVEVSEDVPEETCDHPDLKGTCAVGSRIGRIQGTWPDGRARPEVVWVFFCRRDDNFAQMLGHNTATGATCFLELNNGYMPLKDGLPDGNVPVPSDQNYNDAWKAPADVASQGCNECHRSDPYNHTRWVIGARLPSDPSQPVLPQVAAPDSLYRVIGDAFQEWDFDHIVAPGNGCTTCHRISDFRKLKYGVPTNWNDYMPPNDPGSMAADYQRILSYLERMDKGAKRGPGFSVRPLRTSQ